MLEIFRTNLTKKSEAKRVVLHLNGILPGVSINVDLEDCDRILRIESSQQNFDSRHIIDNVKKMGFECTVLSD